MTSFAFGGKDELIRAKFKEELENEFDEYGDGYPFKFPKVYLEGKGENYFPQSDFSWIDDSVIITRNGKTVKYTQSSFTELLVEEADGKKVWIDGRNAPYTDENGKLIGNKHIGASYSGETRDAITFSIEVFDAKSKTKTTYDCVKKSETPMSEYELTNYGVSIEEASPENKRDTAFRLVCKSFENYKSLPDEYKNDIAFNRELLDQSYDISFFQYIPDVIRSNMKIINKALYKDAETLKYMPDEIRGNRNQILHLIRRNPYGCDFLKYALPSVFDDADFVKLIMSLQPKVLEFLPKNYKNDKELVIKAISREPRLLEYASQALRGDREVVLTAIKYCKDTRCLADDIYQYFSDELKNDRDIALQIIRRGIWSYYMPKKFYQDKELIIEGFRSGCGIRLYDFPETLKNDPEIIYYAVKADFKNAREFNNYKAFIPLLKEDKTIFYYLNIDMQGFPELQDIADISDAEIEFISWNLAHNESKKAKEEVYHVIDDDFDLPF